MILPQALRRLLPPLVSLLVNIIQNTTIAVVIGVNEFLQAGQRQIENDHRGVPPIAHRPDPRRSMIFAASSCSCSS